jgi:hypothetical protein
MHQPILQAADSGRVREKAKKVRVYQRGIIHWKYNAEIVKKCQGYQEKREKRRKKRGKNLTT